MKTTNKRFIYLIFCTLIILGILIANGTGSIVRADEGAGLGWRQFAGRQPDPYFSPLAGELSVGFIPGTDVPLIGLKLDISFEIIECCRPILDEHSWCNYNADEPRCPD